MYYRLRKIHYCQVARIYQTIYKAHLWRKQEGGEGGRGDGKDSDTRRLLKYHKDYDSFPVHQAKHRPMNSELLGSKPDLHVTMLMKWRMKSDHVFTGPSSYPISITAHPSDTSNVSLTPRSHWLASAIVVDAVAKGKPAAMFNSAELPCGNVPGMITVI
jgi:hypothetical protein